MSTARVLVVDDDWAFIHQAAASLEPLADVRTTTSGSDVLGFVSRWMPDVVILDLVLGDADSFTLLECLIRFAEQQPPPYVLCTTNDAELSFRRSPCADWPVGTIPRSVRPIQFREAILDALDARRELAAAS